MQVLGTKLPDTLIIQPKVFGDARGFFVETWHQERYAEVGLPARFAQDNMSASSYGVLRGLHFQHPYGQGKLVTVVEGEVYDVAVDVRVGSPTFGQWTSVILSGRERNQFWIPAGFAHGFCVLSPQAIFAYKCTEIYRPECEMSVRWDDPSLSIPWPIKDPNVSDKDRKGLFLKDIPLDRLPRYQEK